MRQYKKLVIPKRYDRSIADIVEKQENYCKKSDCSSECKICLFDERNITTFEEWYILKNKQKKQG